MVKRFISDTYACLDNRGTLSSTLKTQKYMRRMQKKYGKYYVLQCDIKKFFYSIDKKILLNILNRMISDKKLKEFTEVILNDGTDIGIPIGNYTSQYFANIYLNELDHFIKEHLRVKYYIRYMDDFILLVRTKEEAKNLFFEISIFLKNKLNLELNHKSRYYPSSIGIDFCGYKIFETHILLRKRFKKNVNKKLRQWSYTKSLDIKKLVLSWNSIRAHAKHANSYTFIKKESLKLDILLKSKNIDKLKI